jgi:hypothetical protein
VQNGYGLVFPYVNYDMSLTILPTAETSSINCSAFEPILPKNQSPPGKEGIKGAAQSQ